MKSLNKIDILLTEDISKKAKDLTVKIERSMEILIDKFKDSDRDEILAIVSKNMIAFFKMLEKVSKNNIKRKR